MGVACWVRYQPTVDCQGQNLQRKVWCYWLGIVVAGQIRTHLGLRIGGVNLNPSLQHKGWPGKAACGVTGCIAELYMDQTAPKFMRL